jgi:quercetin dioxygenase-like cupin family protein
MTHDTRSVAPSSRRFVRNADVAAEQVTQLEGHREGGDGAGLAIKPMLAGRDMLLMEVRRDEGLRDAEHAHPDHESICYLVSGRMRVVIEGESFVAEPGDAWIHPPGVMHYHQALEDSVQIEIKSPPRKAWR